MFPHILGHPVLLRYLAVINALIFLYDQSPSIIPIHRLPSIIFLVIVPSGYFTTRSHHIIQAHLVHAFLRLNLDDFEALKITRELFVKGILFAM